MSDKNIAISFENVSKMYRLGLVGTGTLGQDLNRWWKMNVLHQEDPYLKIGQTNDRSTKGSSDFVYALKDIDFKVEQGDVVGIIGKNGAGKSTLLKLLSRITAPTTGSIKTRGRLASLLEVGTGFHPELTGRENIYMNGSIMGMTKAEITRKLDEIIDFAGVERYIDTPTKRYSSGMQVRLGFAVAAFLEPEILVVDEVLAVGDADFQRKAIGKMQDVSSNAGRTVLFVSHNMASVRALCKSALILENGMIKSYGNVDEIVEMYLMSCAQNVQGLPVSELPRESKGSGKLRFEDIKFLDENDNEVHPHCGQPVKFRVFFDVKENIHNVSLSLGLRTTLGQPLTTFPTTFTQELMNFSKGKHFVDCTLPKLPLTAGMYNVALWAAENRKCLDHIQDGIQVEVLDGDFFERGKVVGDNLKGKIMLCPHEWLIC